MRGTPTITPESFDALLSWLAPSREAAGQKYEIIRIRLIKIFVSRGCCNAEDLADTVFNRVIARLPEISSGYVGDPANYFYGVARNVYHEWLRRKEVAAGFLPQQAPQTERGTDMVRECLRECLRTLSPEQAELLLEYYLDEKRAGIERRKDMAAIFGVTANALRLRAHRIRVSLERCVLDCLAKATK